MYKSQNQSSEEHLNETLDLNSLSCNMLNSVTYSFSWRQYPTILFTGHSRLFRHAVHVSPECIVVCLLLIGLILKMNGECVRKRFLIFSSGLVVADEINIMRDFLRYPVRDRILIALYNVVS